MLYNCQAKVKEKYSFYLIIMPQGCVRTENCQHQTVLSLSNRGRILYCNPSIPWRQLTYGTCALIQHVFCIVITHLFPHLFRNMCDQLWVIVFKWWLLCAGCSLCQGEKCILMNENVLSFAKRLTQIWKSCLIRWALFIVSPNEWQISWMSFDNCFVPRMFGSFVPRVGFSVLAVQTNCNIKL